MDSSNNCRLVCVGRLADSKGQETVIRAAAILKAEISDLRIDFLGAGHSESHYRLLTKQLAVEDTCLFLGGLGHSEVMQRITQATISLIPSNAESSSYVAIESLSCGTPVIASKTGGIIEVVRDGIDGILVPKQDPEALASKIRMLHSDPQLRKRLGNNARQRFLDHFEQSIVIPQQADWLEEELSRNRTLASTRILTARY